MYQLSSKLKPFQYLVFVLCLVLFAGWINIIHLSMKGIKKGDDIIDIPICILIGLLLIFIVRRLKDIKFDESLISVTSGRKTEKIPLENILSVKMIMAEMAGVDFYKIVYDSPQGTYKSVRFLPTGNFGGFIIFLKEKNKKVELSNWASNFDI